MDEESFQEHQEKEGWSDDDSTDRQTSLTFGNQTEDLLITSLML